MKTKSIILIMLCISMSAIGQKTTAKRLLDQVSQKMGAYKNMNIVFSSKLTNKKAGIVNEAPIRGKIILSGEKYNLDYLGNKFIFNGKKLVVINTEEQEVTITKGNMNQEDGFIYPSQILTFYKKGYKNKLSTLKTISGRKIQYIELKPIDKKTAISKILLGIDAKTKHIFEMKQIGKNGTTTCFTINEFKSNQTIPKGIFDFDRKKYETQGYLID